MESGNAGSVLIVDDNTTNIQWLGTMLKKENFQIAVALNGIEALQFLEREKVDIILLDIMMPICDGYDTCSIIKKDKRFNTIPVIFLTAKTEMDDIIKGFKVGAVDYITKPFNAEELLARVSVHVELVRSRNEIKKLQSILPICCKCKNIRNDEGYWKKIETYFAENTDFTFSHGLCPDCAKRIYPDLFV